MTKAATKEKSQKDTDKESETATENETETTTEQILDTDKVVYLTFDDGPSTGTEEILTILRQYNVKATFFVVGKEDEYSMEMYEKIVEEGHTLGMHSYSHQYSTIYQSVEDFAKDIRFVTCVFGELCPDGRVREKGTYAKMARGEMVRFMAETRVEKPEQLKEFARLGYQFCETSSTKNKYVFII